ncbi:hypothetical protein [Sulfuriroseicoccus oceanibius]|uniref:Uncharacterized protein n=1 Tax=Sulfuriroseicoccus oceanibius TaxID=2707525 RepID=A0A7T7JBC6_9BACT|nr:hypothetical protein [Sulfuriroseicoccus oceanibius]QQL44065.1 hypothetical protein G3M56_009180 [Sulfuriroseicoccus oceanibius]
MLSARSVGFHRCQTRLSGLLRYAKKMKITCDLYSEWISAIRQEFTKEGFDYSGLGDQDCAIQWQSWNRRIVPPGSRTIEKADTFSCPAELQAGLDGLEEAFTNGDNVKPWQSKLVDKVSYEDGLLNDYGVLHFHLGDTLEGNGYMKRTGPLLFAIVRDAAVYEIGVYGHGAWYELDILNIIDRNWPFLLDPVTIKAIDTAYSPKTKEEVKALRDANVCSIISLDSGRIVMPIGGGVATDGTSNDAVHSADYWAKFLCDADKLVIEHIEECIRKGTLPAKDYQVHLHATATEIAAIVEDKLRIIVWRKQA